MAIPERIRSLPFRIILGTYFAGYLAFATVGALVSTFGSQSATTNPIDVTMAGPLEFFWAVFQGNGRLWLFMCLGTVTFGAAGAVVLLSNALRFGMDAMALATSSPADWPFLFPHAIVEFAAFILAAAACQHLGLRLLDTLATSQSVRRVRSEGARVGVWTLAWSLNFLVMGALVETIAYIARRT
jgi:uncharacterized membrane protein SpoIIM required for sporulation